MNYKKKIGVNNNLNREKIVKIYSYVILAI